MSSKSLCDATYISSHLGVGMGDKVADYLRNEVLRYGIERNRKRLITWSAVIPFAKAFRTLSRVIEPTTRFAKRYFNETNKFKTAVCNGLSAQMCKTQDI